MKITDRRPCTHDSFKEGQDNFWGAAVLLVAILALLLIVGFIEHDEPKSHEKSCQNVDSQPDSSYNKTSVRESDRCNKALSTH